MNVSNHICYDERLTVFFTQLAFLYRKIYSINFLKIMRDEHHQPAPQLYTSEAKIIFLQMALPDLDKFLLLVLIFY